MFDPKMNAWTRDAFTKLRDLLISRKLVPELNSEGWEQRTEDIANEVLYIFSPPSEMATLEERLTEIGDEAYIVYRADGSGEVRNMRMPSALATFKKNAAGPCQSPLQATGVALTAKRRYKAIERQGGDIRLELAQVREQLRKAEEKMEQNVDAIIEARRVFAAGEDSKKMEVSDD